MRILFLLLIMGMLIADSFGMTVIQTANNFCSGVSTCSVTVSATGSGNTIITESWIDDTSFSVSDGTSTFNDYGNDGFYTTPGSSHGIFIDYLYPSNSGKTSITGTQSGTNSMSITVWEVKGFYAPAVDTSGWTSSNVQSGGIATGQPITTTGFPGFIVAFDQSPNTASGSLYPFNAGGIQDSNGSYFASCITSVNGTYTPQFIDNGTGGFNSVTAAFKLVPIPPSVSINKSSIQKASIY